MWQWSILHISYSRSTLSWIAQLHFGRELRMQWILLPFHTVKEPYNNPSMSYDPDSNHSCGGFKRTGSCSVELPTSSPKIWGRPNFNFFGEHRIHFFADSARVTTITIIKDRRDILLNRARQRENREGVETGGHAINHADIANVIPTCFARLDRDFSQPA